MKNLLQIHAEPKAYHGCLQKKLGELSGCEVKRVNEGESVDDAAHQCNGGRHETTRREDHSDEEYIFGHRSSVAEKLALVQAVVLMPHLRNLSEEMAYLLFGFNR